MCCRRASGDCDGVAQTGASCNSGGLGNSASSLAEWVSSEDALNLNAAGWRRGVSNNARLLKKAAHNLLNLLLICCGERIPLGVVYLDVHI